MTSSPPPPPSAVGIPPPHALAALDAAAAEPDGPFGSPLRLSRADTAGVHWRAARFHLGAYIDAMHALRTGTESLEEEKAVELYERRKYGLLATRDLLQMDLVVLLRVLPGLRTSARRTALRSHALLLLIYLVRVYAKANVKLPLRGAGHETMKLGLVGSYATAILVPSVTAAFTLASGYSLIATSSWILFNRSITVVERVNRLSAEGQLGPENRQEFDGWWWNLKY